MFEWIQPISHSICLLACRVRHPQFHWLFTTACRYICIYTNARLSTHRYISMQLMVATRESVPLVRRFVPLVRIAFPVDRWQLPLCAVASVCHRISGRILSSVPSFVSIKSPPPSRRASALSLVISSPDFRYTFSSCFIWLPCGQVAASVRRLADTLHTVCCIGRLQCNGYTIYRVYIESNGQIVTAQVAAYATAFIITAVCKCN